MNQTYVPLVEDIHIASVARATKKTKIPAQSAHICTCKVRKNPNLPEKEIYELSPLDNGYLSQEPGLMIPNTIVKLTASRHLSVMIVNSANKSFTVKKGCSLARIQAVPDATISSLDKNKTNWK